MSLQSLLNRSQPPLLESDGPTPEPIADQRLHWFALYTYWKTLPITIGLVTLISLLPGIVALLLVTGFGLFYEFGEELPSFLKDTVLQDIIDYELQGAGPFLRQLRHNRYHPELTIILGAVAVTWIVLRTLEWRSTRYGVDSQHFWIRGGVFWKWERRLPMERLQSIELRANLLHRLLDLRTVEVTSSSPEKGAATIQLAAIPAAEAMRIQRIVLDAASMATDERYAALEEDRTETQLADISTGQLLAAGITSFEIRLSFVGAIAAFHLFSKSFLKTWRNEAIHWFISTIERKHAFADLVDATLLLLVVIWVLSIITFMTTFSRFRLQRLGQLALIEHGLVTRRWRAVLLPRVQAVAFVETPVQEWRRTGSLRMELTGSHQRSLDRKMLLPSLPRAQALATLEQLFGGAFFDNIARQLDQIQRLPDSSKRLYSFFWVYRIAGLTVMLALIDWATPSIRFQTATVIGILLLAIPGYFYGRRQFADAAWLLDDKRELIVRERHINRRTIICPADRLQWSGLMQMRLPGRKPGPATVVGYVAASGKVDGVAKAFVQTGWPVFDGRLRIRGIPLAEAEALLERMRPQPGQAEYRPPTV